MGNHTFLGLVTSWDQIHQPHSILLAHSLRKNSENTPTKHTPTKAVLSKIGASGLHELFQSARP